MSGSGYTTERNRLRLKKYGVSPVRYQELLQAQNGRCAICEGLSKNMDSQLAVDHDHDSGLVRGLLCRDCNAGLGIFRDSADRLIRAAQYIQRRAPLGGGG